MIDRHRAQVNTSTIPPHERWTFNKAMIDRSKLDGNMKMLNCYCWLFRLLHCELCNDDLRATANEAATPEDQVENYFDRFCPHIHAYRAHACAMTVCTNNLNGTRNKWKAIYELEWLLCGVRIEYAICQLMRWLMRKQPLGSHRSDCWFPWKVREKCAEYFDWYQDKFFNAAILSLTCHHSLDHRRLTSPMNMKKVFRLTSQHSMIIICLIATIRYNRFTII